MTTIWIRAETKTREERAPISPQDAARLIAAGFELVVEESDARDFVCFYRQRAGVTFLYHQFKPGGDQSGGVLR